MDDKIKQNNSNIAEGLATQELSSNDETNNKTNDFASLLSLSEHLQKIRYMHKSSVKDYAVEIRKIKKIIAVEQSKLNQKII